MKKNQQNKIIIGIIGIIIIALLGKEYYKENKNAKTEINGTSVEDFMDFSIIREQKVYSEKLSLDIRLQQEYKKTTLEKFAHYIKHDFAKKDYERIFITYYLPGMEVGSGAWATSHFKPDLSIFMTSSYFDNTKDDFDKQNKSISSSIKNYVNNSENKNFLGFWRENENYIVTIFKKFDNYYLNEIQFKKNEIGKDYELIVKTDSNKNFYIIKELLYPENNLGTKYLSDYTDYYYIEPNGNLSLYDKIGIIESYDKIEADLE